MEVDEVEKALELPENCISISDDEDEDEDMKSIEDTKVSECQQYDNEESNAQSLHESRRTSEDTSDESEVYIEDGLPYSIVLGERDDSNKIHATLEMKILKEGKYFTLLGYSIPSGDVSLKTLEFQLSKKSSKKVCKKFKKTYKDRTGNFWELNAFLELPDKLVLLEGKKKIERNFQENGAHQRTCGRTRHLGTSWTNSKDSTGDLIKERNELVKLLFDSETVMKTLQKLEFKGCDLGCHKKVALGDFFKMKNLRPAIQALDGILKNWKKIKKANSLASAEKAKSFVETFYETIPVNERKAEIDIKSEFVQLYELLKSVINMQTTFRMFSSEEESSETEELSLYKSLNTEIKIIDEDSGKYRSIQKYVKNTTFEGVNLQVLEGYSINRRREKVLNAAYEKLENKKMLWHGSLMTNFPSILKNGFQRASSSFGSFGHGIYFTDVASESVNHCQPSSSGGIVLMALCEVALGNVHKIMPGPNKIQISIKGIPKRKHSIVSFGNYGPDPNGNHSWGDNVIIPLGKLGPLETEKASYVTKLLSKQHSGLKLNNYFLINEDLINIQYLVKIKVG